MLAGRSAETAALDRLLEAAREGRSGVLVIRGEAGIGKSALLEHAVAQADGMTVLRGVGIESESELAFAALHQLLRPVLDRIDRLPDPQAAALRAAFALSAETVSDRFRVSLGVLGLLSEVAEERPLLCVLDDAQWLDQASADALVFAARRLDAEPLAVLFAARDDPERPFAAPGLPELRPGPLDAADARAVVAALAGPGVSPDALDWVLESAHGNPLALVELPSSLSAGQLAGRERFDRSLPSATSVEQSYLDRVERLPSAVQRLLVLAAAEETGDRATIAQAAAELGLDDDDLAQAEADGLVRVTSTRVDFRHPLVRSAVYRGAGFAERERAHQALASVLVGDEDADRRAWHRAASTSGPDDGAAYALEQTAVRARLRAGHAAASAALERAAELSSEPAERARRLIASARAASLAGRDERATALAGRAAPLIDEPLLRAEIGRVLGVGEVRRGNPGEGQRILIEAARDIAPIAPETAVELLFHAAEAGVLHGDMEAFGSVFALADALVPAIENEHSRVLAQLISGIGALLSGDPARGAPLVETMLARVDQSDPWQLMRAGAGAVMIGDDERAAELCGRAAALARASGAVALVAQALSLRAMPLLWCSRFDDVSIDAAEAARLGKEIGADNVVAQPLAALAAVAAVRGREEEAFALTDEVSKLAAVHGLAMPAAFVSWTLGILDLARSRWTEALARLEPLRQVRPGFGHPFVVIASAPDRIEAAVRAGRLDAAREEVPVFEAWATHSPASWARPRLASCRALVASGDDATRHFEEALTMDGDARPFDLARIQLLYGEHLRRERRRMEAREPLRAALASFERFGAVLWAERAHNELRATGETARKRDPSTVLELTPQELQIARLVAEGSSNKEVAGQLFLSPRTVEYHLRKVFSKLGITSRAELIRRGVGEQAASETAAA
jgi:DNA-binding CsgD family transcriptional regulator